MSKAHRVLGFALMLAVASSARAVPVQLELLTGDHLPEDQGWTLFVSGAAISNDGSATRIDTITPGGASFAIYSRTVPLDPRATFEIEWTVHVIDSANDSFDTGVGLLGSYSGPLLGGTPVDRANTIHLLPDEITWGDLSDSHALDTTDGFHTYVLRVEPDGSATVSVDGQASLTKTDYAVSRPWQIAFGDTTNSQGLNGIFEIQGVAIRGEPFPLPEPTATAWGALIGLSSLSILRSAKIVARSPSRAGS